MKKIITVMLFCLLNNLTAQINDNYKNVVIETENKLIFVNWFRTDTSLDVCEIVIDKKNTGKTIEDYWWAKKENNSWVSNLPKDIDIYIKDNLTKYDISWMNLPNVSKENISFGFNQKLLYNKFNYWLQN